MNLTNVRTQLRNEDGTAITEFVIVLPIFILVFSGMGMLYRYSHEGAVARMKTAAALAANTQADNNFQDISPGSGSIALYGWQVAGLGSNEQPIYDDSKQKIDTVISRIGGSVKAPAGTRHTESPQLTLMGGGTAASESFANNLLDDGGKTANLTIPESLQLGPLASLVSSAAANLGVGLSGGAGIRYTVRQANVSHSFHHPWTGSTTYNPGTLTLAAPTAATWRLAPVAISRVAMHTIQPYETCTLEFNTDMCMDNVGGNVTGSDVPPGGPEQVESECQQEMQAYQACMTQAMGDLGYTVTDDTEEINLSPAEKTYVDMACGDPPEGSCRALGEGALDSLMGSCGSGTPECQKPSQRPNSNPSEPW